MASSISLDTKHVVIVPLRDDSDDVATAVWAIARPGKEYIPEPAVSLATVDEPEPEVVVRVPDDVIDSYDQQGAEPFYDVSVQATVCAYDWPCSEALRVVLGPTPPNRDAPHGCPNGESSGNASANNNGNIGWFQINLVHGYTVAQLMDPVFNTRVAYALWQDQGWSPWSCRPY